VPAFAQRVNGPRFGPFFGAFRVGTAVPPGNLTVEPGSGLLPDHATVTLYPSGVFGVEPAPGAPVWLAVQGRAPLYPIGSAVQVNPGDHVVLGTQAGPRLVLEVEADVARAVPATAVGASAAAWGARANIAGPRPGLPAAVGNEIVRQGQVRMLARVGPLRDAYYLMNRFRGGSLTSPTMLVSIVFAVGAAVATGTMTCSGLLSMIWWKLTYH